MCCLNQYLYRRDVAIYVTGRIKPDTVHKGEFSMILTVRLVTFLCIVGAKQRQHTLYWVISVVNYMNTSIPAMTCKNLCIYHWKSDKRYIKIDVLVILKTLFIFPPSVYGWCHVTEIYCRLSPVVVTLFFNIFVWETWREKKNCA